MREGEAADSPGCPGMGASVGGAGGCTLGGVDEHLRAEDEPLRDTQEVSITRTPMLQRDRDSQPIRSREGMARGQGGTRRPWRWRGSSPVRHLSPTEKG